MAAIFYVSSLSVVPIPAGTDKPWHALAYFGLAVVVLRALAGGLPRRIDTRTAVHATLMAIGYAFTDEFHQMFVPGRSADLRDIGADAIGVVAGTIVCWAWGIISPASRDGR